MTITTLPDIKALMDITAADAEVLGNCLVGENPFISSPVLSNI